MSYKKVIAHLYTPETVPNPSPDGYTFALMQLADALSDNPSGSNAAEAVCARLETLLGPRFKLVTDDVRQRLGELSEKIRQGKA